MGHGQKIYLDKLIQFENFALYCAKIQKSHHMNNSNEQHILVKAYVTAITQGGNKVISIRKSPQKVENGAKYIVGISNKNIEFGNVWVVLFDNGAAAYGCEHMTSSSTDNVGAYCNRYFEGLAAERAADRNESRQFSTCQA